MMQSQTLTRGNVVVDVEVDIYYDALEYDINDAADETFIDVGLSPIHVRGGAAGSDEREGRSRTNRATRAKRNLSPKRAFQATTAKVKGTVQKIKTSLSDSQPSLGWEEEDEALTPIAANDRLRGSAPDQEAAVPPLPLTDSTIKFATPDDYGPPPPPDETPLRFLRAGKDDPVEGRRRYDMTLAWRKEIDMDHQIRKPSPHFATIKQHYPQFFHLRGRNNEPVWYERPPGVNLRALREAGVNLEALLLHYATVTEFGWQYLETDDMGRSITVIDLEGMRMTDFAGEVVDFTRKCSASTGDHYPERAGHVIVVNVPSWFKSKCFLQSCSSCVIGCNAMLTGRRSLVFCYSDLECCQGLYR